ncbi:MAG: hypothetical protein ACKVT2_05185 [Saprospiraceae bacterium]
MKKYVIYCFLMLSIFSCFRKKTPSLNISSWLETYFPNQFDVLDSNVRMLDVLAQLKGEKQALVSEKQDPELQFYLDWQKNSSSLGIDSSTVISAYERAKKDIANGRYLFKLLKEKGLNGFSVGVIDHAAYILVFLEPIPKAREQLLTTIKMTLGAGVEPAQTSIFIEIMEPDSLHAEFKDIIPYGHWITGRAWQEAHKIMSLDFEWINDLDWSALNQKWELNSMSKRSSQYREFARQKATDWAQKNLPKPFFMPSNRPFSCETVVQNGPAIRYGFPYYDQNIPEEASAYDPEPKGYVAGTYSFDQKTFTLLKNEQAH